MKKYFLYTAVVIVSFYYGCDKPGPTELVDDTETFDVEVIAKDLDNEYYSNGYDTSGVTETTTTYGSLISVSGINITKNGLNAKFSSAQTFVFDMNEPFYFKEILLGYKTITPGIIKFADIQARLTNYRIRFKDKDTGILIDTVLGKKYELFHRHGNNWGDQFNFPYNSSITFTYNAFIGQGHTQFEIATPVEVTGSVRLIPVNDNKFRAELNWNGENTNNFSIIVGGAKNVATQVVPLFRIKTNDDGRLVIPKAFFENLKHKFNMITISFVRKYVSIINGSYGDIYINSQSIHTLFVDLP